MDDAPATPPAKRVQKHRDRKPRQRTPRPHAWWLQGHVSVAGISDGERKLLFPMIASAVRTVLGHCFKAALVTHAQQEQIAELVTEAVEDAGLKLIPLGMLRRRIEFWLKVNDPAKALWFGHADVGAAHVQVAQAVPHATLAAVNAEYAAKLRGRLFDHYVLAVALCIISKNSIVENGRTRKEENGTKALRECLNSFGISANGTLASQCFKVLGDAGLINCTDRDFEVGKRCRRWIPVGQSWSIPLLAKLPDSDLSEQQLASRDVYRASLKSPNENGWGRLYRIGSHRIPDTQTTTHTAITQTTITQPTVPQTTFTQSAISEGWSWIGQAVLEQAAKEQIRQYVQENDYMEDQEPDLEMVDIFAVDFDDDDVDDEDFSPPEHIPLFGPVAALLPVSQPAEAPITLWPSISTSPPTDAEIRAIMSAGPHAIINDPDLRRRILASPPMPIPF